jgi:hypothetical protein
MVPWGNGDDVLASIKNGLIRLSVSRNTQPLAKVADGIAKIEKMIDTCFLKGKSSFLCCCCEQMEAQGCCENEMANL